MAGMPGFWPGFLALDRRTGGWSGGGGGERNTVVHYFFYPNTSGNLSK